MGDICYHWIVFVIIGSYVSEGGHVFSRKSDSYTADRFSAHCRVWRSEPGVHQPADDKGLEQRELSGRNSIRQHKVINTQALPHLVAHILRTNGPWFGSFGGNIHHSILKVRY